MPRTKQKSAEPADIRVPLGQRIRQLRERANLAQSDLAKASGVSRVYLGVVERGEKEAGVTVIEKIAHGLGVPVVELFRFEAGDDDKKPATRLGRKVASLARSADDVAIEKFMRIAKAFFETPEERAFRHSRRKKKGSR